MKGTRRRKARWEGEKQKPKESGVSCWGHEKKRRRRKEDLQGEQELSGEKRRR